MLARAIAIAATAHAAQTDKAGQPYILHPLRLMLRLEDEPARIAAVLHDLLEDTDWTLERLRAEAFPQEVLDALEALTRRPDESYEAFVARAARDPIARRVKLADLEDNLDTRRLATLGETDAQRLQKYHRAWRQLREAPGRPDSLDTP